MKAIDGYFMDNPGSANHATELESERLTLKVDAKNWISQFDAYHILYRINKHIGSFLDVGCGTHVIGTAIAEKYKNISVTGVDSNKERLASVKAAVRHLPNVNVCNARATGLPFLMNRFDFVHSRFLFEYLDTDAEAALQEMTRVCRRGGRVVVQDLDENMVKHTGMDESLYADLMFIVARLAEHHVFDPYMGSKLQAMFLRNGLVKVEVDKRIYHDCNGIAPAAFIQRETRKFNNLLPVLTNIFNDGQRALQVKNKYLEHLLDPGTSTQSFIYTVHGEKPSVAEEISRLKAFYSKVSMENNSHVTVKPDDFIDWLLKQEEEIQRKLLATKFTDEGEIVMSCYIQPLCEEKKIYALRGVASTIHDYKTISFVNRFLLRNKELTFIAKVTDGKINKSLQVLGFKVYDDSNGGFASFKKEHATCLELYVNDPWNKKTEQEYLESGAVFCIKHPC
ncbi:MAG: methyltransferase domain-containing protein [Bacteroidota bacterium]